MFRIKYFYKWTFKWCRVSYIINWIYLSVTAGITSVTRFGYFGTAKLVWNFVTKADQIFANILWYFEFNALKSKIWCINFCQILAKIGLLLFQHQVALGRLKMLLFANRPIAERTLSPLVIREYSSRCCEFES